MKFQSIISFLTSPYGIVILIGLFSALGRMFKSAQEQQAKKRANSQLRQARRDSLRTGGQVSSGGDTKQTASIQSQPGKQSSNASWDQKQQIRHDRIEQLRAQRVEQLKKIRQKRSTGKAQSQPVQSGPNAQMAQLSQARTPAPPARQPAPASQPYKRPVAQPYAQPSTPRRPSQVQPQQPAPRRRTRPNVVAQQVSDESRRVSQSKTDSSIAYGTASIKNSTPASEAGAFFRKNIRQSIIAKEILGTPIGLRSPDSESMGTL